VRTTKVASFSSIAFRSVTICDTVIAGGAPMPAPAPAKESKLATSSLEERIHRRAFELYVLHGNQSGSELDDWLQAEEEVRRAEEAMAVHWRPER